MLMDFPQQGFPVEERTVSFVGIVDVPPVSETVVLSRNQYIYSLISSWNNNT